MPSVTPLHYYTQETNSYRLISKSMNFSYNYINANLMFNKKNNSDDNSSNNTFIKGLISGLVGSFVVYPIDVVKTRMQNQNKSIEKIYKNGFDCWSKLWRQEGIKPFYRGCLMQLIGVGPEKAVKLFAYKYVTNKNENTFKNHLLGGLTAGICQVFITNPYEMIKINLQMNKKLDFKLLSLKKLYTGASACFLRDIPFSGIYFPLYWHLKDNNELHPFIAGTIAGGPAAFLCTPADVIKTRMQTIRQNTQNENSVKLLSTISQVYRNEGFSAFWKGASWRVLRSSPQFGITLLVFEYLL